MVRGSGHELAHWDLGIDTLSGRISVQPDLFGPALSRAFYLLFLEVPYNLNYSATVTRKLLVVHFMSNPTGREWKAFFFF